jgi:hypothetical protein
MGHLRLGDRHTLLGRRDIIVEGVNAHNAVCRVRNHARYEIETIKHRPKSSVRQSILGFVRLLGFPRHTTERMIRTKRPRYPNRATEPECARVRKGHAGDEGARNARVAICAHIIAATAGRSCQQTKRSI